jgi:hypothetical protein
LFKRFCLFEIITKTANNNAPVIANICPNTEDEEIFNGALRCGYMMIATPKTATTVPIYSFFEIALPFNILNKMTKKGERLISNVTSPIGASIKAIVPKK